MLSASIQGQPGDPAAGHRAARGQVYLSNTVNGQFAMLACFVSHRTSGEAVAQIVSEVVAAASQTNF